MRRLDFALAFTLAATVPALAAAEGHVTGYNRPELRIYDESGQPLGVVKASDMPRNAAVVKQGKGGSIGVMQGGRMVFLRPLDVNTEGVGVQCKTVQVATRSSGSALASQTMGVGSAKDCRPDKAAGK